MYKISLLTHPHPCSVAADVRAFKRTQDRNKWGGNLFLQKETERLKQGEKVPEVTAVFACKCR